MELATEKRQNTFTPWLLVIVGGLFLNQSSLKAETEFARMLGVTNPSVAKAIADGASKKVYDPSGSVGQMDREVSQFLLNAPGNVQKIGIEGAYRSQRFKRPERQEGRELSSAEKRKEALSQLEFRKDVEAAMQKILSFQPTVQSSGNRRRVPTEKLGRLLRSRQADLSNPVWASEEEYIMIEDEEYEPRKRLLKSLDGRRRRAISADRDTNPFDVSQRFRPSKNLSVSASAQPEYEENNRDDTFDALENPQLRNPLGNKKVASGHSAGRVVISPSRAIRIINEGNKAGSASNGVRSLRR